MTIAAARKISAQEFLQRPISPENQRVELVNGEVIVSPRPSRSHQYASVMLSHILIGHIEQHQLGILFPEIDATFGPFDVRVPDLLFFAAANVPAGDIARTEAFPDLCIEILSPTNARTDRIEKFELYESKGVADYWIVDPEERTIEAYSLVNGRYIAAGRGADDQVVKLSPFPTLEIPLAKLWLL